MKKIILFVTFSLLCIIVYGQTKYNIKGKTPDRLNGKIAMLLFKNIESGDISDIETTIIKNNQFHFIGEINTYNLLGVKDIDDICAIALEKFPDNDIGTEFFLEEGNILIELDTVSRISGTPNNDLLQTYNQLTKRPFSHSHVQFIIDNLDNFLSVKAFREYYQQISDYDLNNILASATDNFRTNEDVIMCIQSREIIKSIHEKDEKRMQNRETKCPDFELMTSNGEKKKLYNYIGKTKYLVIDFWASWCGPCIKGMPHLKMLSEKYKSKGIEFIGISLDTEDARDNWINAVKRINMPWPQLSDLAGTDSELAKHFAVSDVPYTVIVNEEGIILESVRLPIVNLEPVLERLP